MKGSEAANAAAKQHQKQERKQQHQQSSSGSAKGVEEPNHTFPTPWHKKRTSAVAKTKVATSHKTVSCIKNQPTSSLFLKAIKFRDSKAALDKTCDILRNNSLRGKKRQ